MSPAKDKKASLVGADSSDPARLESFYATRVRPPSLPQPRWLGNIATGKTRARLPNAAKNPKNVLDAPLHELKLAEDEPDATAILPEPRSVKKQFPINSVSYQYQLMHPIFSHDHHVASDQVPFDAAQGALDELIASARSRLDGIRREASEFRSIGESHRQQLRALLGDSGYEQFRALRAERSAHPGNLTPLPDFPTDDRRRRADLQQRVRKLLAKLKVNPARLHAVNKQTGILLANSIPAPPTRHGKLLTLVRPSDVPRDIRDGKANPWTVFRPPFLTGSWYTAGWSSGFKFNPTLYLSGSGMVGNHNYLWDDDASDYDLAQVEYNASVGFWYKMPDNGRLDVWIEVESDDSTRLLTLRDEPGISDAIALQLSYIAVKVDGLTKDPWQKFQTSNFTYNGNEEGTWTRTYFPFKARGWAHLATENWFPKDSWVHVAAGTTTWQRVMANDMHVYGHIRFIWEIKSVWVEPIF